jgi:lysozyme
MRIKTLVFILSLATVSGASATEFNAPWLDPANALVIDPYSGNSIDWDKLATQPRVIAIIHKSTIGTNKIDASYFKRKEVALKKGYLWGSYHWGVTGNPEGQADFYIDTVKPAPDELIALDLEDAQSKTLMNADEAIRFIERIKVRTGRYPVLYTNHASAKLISIRYKDSVLTKAPLWYARFRPKVNDFPTEAWSSYTLWQFSSEILPQFQIPGTKSDIDINVFNGTVDQLKKVWPLTRVD